MAKKSTHSLRPENQPVKTPAQLEQPVEPAAPEKPVEQPQTRPVQPVEPAAPVPPPWDTLLEVVPTKDWSLDALGEYARKLAMRTASDIWKTAEEIAEEIVKENDEVEEQILVICRETERLAGVKLPDDLNTLAFVTALVRMLLQIAKGQP